jgi:glycosyltransferase involved in cell wall biosynthesis
LFFYPILAILFLFSLYSISSSLFSLKGSVKLFRENKRQCKIKGKVAVIIPIKGIDIGLEENVKAIMSQNGVEYDVIFVVDSEEEESLKVLRNYKVNVIKVGDRKGGSGKVSALIEGSKYALEKGYDYLVFMDSDVRPKENHLVNLLCNLGCVSTSYRVYPLKEVLLNLWNLVAVSSFLLPRPLFVWGGSFAIEREKFKEMGFPERWYGKVVDDAEVTKACLERGERINFTNTLVLCHQELKGVREKMNWFVMESAFFRNFWRREFYFSLTSQLTFALVHLTILIDALLNFYLGVYLIISSLIISSFSAYLKIAKWSYGKVGDLIITCFLYPISVYVMLYSLIASMRVKEIKWRGNIVKLRENGV